MGKEGFKKYLPALSLRQFFHVYIINHVYIIICYIVYIINKWLLQFQIELRCLTVLIYLFIYLCIITINI